MRWRKYKSHDNSWELLTHLTNVPELLKFHSKIRIEAKTADIEFQSTTS